MATRKAREIRASLKRKGFREDAGGKHWKLVLQVDERDTQIFTVVSFDERDYGDNLLGIMAKHQLRITKRELLGLIDCPMTGAEYVQRLKAQGIVG